MDRFTSDTRTRKIIQDLTMPILDNQMKLQQKVEFDIEVKINDITDRLERAQYALY